MFLRFASLSLIIAAVAFSWACIERPMKVADPAPNVISDFSAAQAATRDVDLIFLVDSSLSMADEQVILQGNFANLMQVLKDISGGLPNLHLGIITPDLGSLPYNIPGCNDEANGDNGLFMKGAGNACTNPVNQNYVVDVEPRGCTIEKNVVEGQATQCISHDCSQANCDVAAFTGLDGIPTEPAGLALTTDANDCPRCINYTVIDPQTGELPTLEAVFKCMASVGTSGCGMEQPLEAVKRALETRTGANTGFWRDNAYLAIFIISDEDDCSAKQPELFNPAGNINDTLGTLTSFRCTEFGVKCDQEWQRVMPQGQLTYTNCKPREATDPKNMLFPISVYTNYLSQLKDSSMIIVGAITGPYANQLTVGLDNNQNPKLQPSCGIPTEGADPAVRLKALVTSFIQEEEDMQWAFTSICATDFSVALEGLGNKIKGLVEVQCITTPLNGCPDPAFANGEAKLTDLPDAEAAVCEPLCSVQDIDIDGNVTEIPLCAATYLGGHPPKLDQSLPVAKCYHVTYNADCAVPCPDETSLALGCHPTNSPWYAPSRGAEIIISRRTTATVGTKAKIACAGLPLTEKLCFDGVDNDSDGNIDMADPDCL
ncbi:MAG: hypothetical protein CVU65_00285 [Deltaproteobacteria bacterium HGW-Deltaproteobacteria-22]|jgi:hypothetical protein|nr:MAG: hypothetical protein CVU65_00285 [Deltaproteobacteria bacterium HGW-Deltaproteobacteria-22]